MCLAPSEMTPNDPHLPVFTCLCDPSPLVCGLDEMPCFYQIENGKGGGLSLPRLGYKRLCLQDGHHTML